MPNTTVRADARTLPEATDADRRSIMRTFLALTGAVATATVWNAGKTRAERRRTRANSYRSASVLRS